MDLVFQGTRTQVPSAENIYRVHGNIGDGKKSIGAVGPTDSGRDTEMNKLQRRDAARRNAIHDTSIESIHPRQRTVSVDTRRIHLAIRNDRVPRMSRVSRALVGLSADARVFLGTFVRCPRAYTL